MQLPGSKVTREAGRNLLLHRRKAHGGGSRRPPYSHFCRSCGELIYRDRPHYCTGPRRAH